MSSERRGRSQGPFDESEIPTTPPDTAFKLKKQLQRQQSEESNSNSESIASSSPTPRPKSKMTGSSNTGADEAPSSNLTEREQFQLRMREMELEIARLKAGMGVQQIQPPPRSKLAEFKKEVLSRSPHASFKLDSINYEEWSDEILSVALTIEAKGILKNRQITCPDDEEDKEIWDFKSKTLFDVIFAALEPSIKRNIKNRIEEDNRNGTELWIALEAEYKTHVLDIRTTTGDKLAKISIADYNNDVTKYIAAFRRTNEKLKALGHPLPQWFVTDRFISGLKNHQSTFIHTKKDEIRDPEDKGKFAELNLEHLMDQLLTRASASEKTKASKDEMDSKDDKKETSARGGQFSQSKTKCSYCGWTNHQVSTCAYKNPSMMDTEWQERNKDRIEELRRKDAAAKQDIPYSSANRAVGYLAKQEDPVATDKLVAPWRPHDGESGY